MHKTNIFNFILLLVLLYSVLALLWPLYGFLSPIAVVVDIIFAIATIYMFYKSKKNTNRTIKLLVIILLLYSILLLILTTPGIRSLIELVKSKYVLYPYLCILFSLIRYDINTLNTMKKISIISIICYMFFVFYFRGYLIARYNFTYIDNTISLDEIVKDFCYSSGFLLLITPCIKKKYSLFIIVIYILSIFIAMLLARRNVIVTSSLFLMGAIINFLSFYKHNVRYKFFLLGILFAIACVSFSELKALLNGESDLEIFSTLNNRLMSDSRSDVIKEFNNSMSTFNWIFGKGFSASYFSSSLGERNVIETGYLNIIFRIGIINLGIYILILLKSISVKSDNIIILASKMYIIIAMLETLYAGVPTFNIRWIMIWVCVSFCFNTTIKSLSNQQIKQLLCA